MGKPVLTYFNVIGRGEAIRLALKISEIQFEDKRVTVEEWKREKASSPLGTLPTFEMDGEQIAQSVAILLYVAIKGKLIPADPVAAAKVTQLLCAVEDVLSLISNGTTAVEELQPIAIGKLLNFTDSWIPRMDDIVKANGNPGFSVGDSLTVADLAIYSLMKIFRKGVLWFIPTDAMDTATHLGALYDKVEEHPKVIEWNKDSLVK